MSFPDALLRWQELAARDAMTAAGNAELAPLTVAEHLEALALREVLARYFRHPSAVQRALVAGATWEQVGAAAGCTAGEAQAGYVRRTGGRPGAPEGNQP
jgi:hypothetical protein